MSTAGAFQHMFKGTRSAHGGAEELVLRKRGALYVCVGRKPLEKRLKGAPESATKEPKSAGVHPMARFKAPWI